MKTRLLIPAVVLLLGFPAFAQGVKKSYRGQQTFTLSPGGSLMIENPVGNVEIIGTDAPNVRATIVTIIRGVSETAVQEGRQQTGVIVGGDHRSRVLRATVAPTPGKEWSAAMHWQVQVPRTAHVSVVTRAGDRVRLGGMRGSVHVKNINGSIVLHDVTGHAVADSVNGSVIYIAGQPQGNVQLSSVNGDITVSLAANADFRWVAETVKGDIRTTMPARGAFFGNTFRGSINAPGGPTITTASLMGNVNLISTGSRVAEAQSLRRLPATMASASSAANMNGGLVRREPVKGLFTYATNLGDVRVGEIQGNADVYTGAGQVQLGSVTGSCKVRSLGGPLQLGEIFGELTATTRAGDILVDTARRGGTIATRGGTIRLLYTSGPTRLISGGGDITVRQAAAPISAETQSGDIAIAVDPTSRRESINARTAKGNIVLNVSSAFGADVEATIVTSDPTGDTIVSDIPGLSISRDQIGGGKTRVHATGKLNGGGARVVLEATGGDIRISTQPAGPTVVRPR